MNRSFRFASLVLLPLVALAGCKRAGPAATATQSEVPLSVKTAAAEDRPVSRILALTGTLRGQRETDLAANATGRVLATYVERGQLVKAGDVLARLDVRSASLVATAAKAQAELARAHEETAKRECERYQTLLDREAISRAEYDKIADQCRSTSLSVQAAQARAASASQTLSDGTVRAPFAGVIGERYVEAGEYVRHDSKIVTLVGQGPLRLLFAVPEVHVPVVTFGRRVRLRVPAYPERVFEGVVQYVGAQVRETTRDLPVEAVVPNSDGLLRPGMFASLELELGETPQPTVPTTALRRREGRAAARRVLVPPRDERAPHPLAVAQHAERRGRRRQSADAAGAGRRGV